MSVANWRLKLGTRNLKWVFLALYLMIVIGLSVLAYSGEIGFREDVGLFAGFEGQPFAVGLVLVVALASQILLVFGAGTSDLCRPVRMLRFLVPILAVSFFLMLLSWAFVLSVLYDEIIGIFLDSSDTLMISLTFGLWGIWPIVFGFLSFGVEKYRAIRRLVRSVFAGSLLSLMVSIPYLIVAGWPEWLLFIPTHAADIATELGLAVLFWSLGAVILLMFLKEIRNQQLRGLAHHGGQE